MPLLEGEAGSGLASLKPPVAEYYPPPEVARTVRAEVELTESSEISVDSDAHGDRCWQPLPNPILGPPGVCSYKHVRLCSRPVYQWRTLQPFLPFTRHFCRRCCCCRCLCCCCLQAQQSYTPASLLGCGFVSTPLSRRARVSRGPARSRGGRAAGAGHSACLEDLQHALTYKERVHLTAREFVERGLMEQVRCTPLLFGVLHLQPILTTCFQHLVDAWRVTVNCLM